MFYNWLMHLKSLTSFFMGIKKCLQEKMQKNLDINVYFYSCLAQVYEEEVLTLNKISRSDMGAYLCIASNGIPPSVSKRITIKVHCEYKNYFYH